MPVQLQQHNPRRQAQQGSPRQVQSFPHFSRSSCQWNVGRYSVSDHFGIDPDPPFLPRCGSRADFSLCSGSGSGPSSKGCVSATTVIQRPSMALFRVFSLRAAHLGSIGISAAPEFYFDAQFADPGSGAFLTFRSGMGKKSWSGPGIQIRDEQPGSYFLELRNHFLGLKYLNSLMRIRDPGWKKLGSGIGDGKIRILDKHPVSATLLMRIRSGFVLWYGSGSASLNDADPFGSALLDRYMPFLALPTAVCLDSTVSVGTLFCICCPTLTDLL